MLEYLISLSPGTTLGTALERTPAAEALALELVTQTDLLRLKVIARLHARGLPPDISWSDLLQEAFARVLDGSRRQPDGLPMVPFLAGVMRSIKTEYWRRTRREARQFPKLLIDLDPATATRGEAAAATSPERTLIAIQELAALEQLFAHDVLARRGPGWSRGGSLARGDLLGASDVKDRLRFDTQTHSTSPASRGPQVAAAMKPPHPERAFDRLLLALEHELLTAPEEEVFAAAQELGMNPAMKGSAAFFGVTLMPGPHVDETPGSRPVAECQERARPLRWAGAARRATRRARAEPPVANRTDRLLWPLRGAGGLFHRGHGGRAASAVGAHPGKAP